MHTTDAFQMEELADQSDQSNRKENSTIDQDYPARSVFS